MFHSCNVDRRQDRALPEDALVFPGYEQQSWVAIQDYQTAPWAELVDLWRLFNLHLARLMSRIPADVRLRPRASHNLDELAWQAVPRHTPATLDYFMEDYVGHLHHHLRQIQGLLFPPAIAATSRPSTKAGEP